MLGMWPKQAQDEVWGRHNETSDALICASVIFPAGSARRVDGGYLLSGHRPFCSGIYTRNPISRAFRDIYAACAHVAFSVDAAGTTYGRIALGLESDNISL